ncbi:hypothetical protein GIB67_015014 [Kingdonia uniflora]|uniref:Small G protein signalling modulator 1/2 Rab-binding domain-containing protein n=1 Tax=Kingdonia uniflora TaxID=39325 RepID=A0A7J7MTW0_9MAGN|nr:hypothetical protein GIB67_015014 [Kingdonia uniflora]
MQEPELHDLSDDADYAASQQQQQGGRGISRTDSGKRSMGSEADGAEVVYMKDNVTIHPTQYASERISGRLRLIKHGSSLFMTWIPYKAIPASTGYAGHGSNAKLTERGCFTAYDRTLYTIRAVPFSDVRSIRRHTPTLGWQYVIVVLSSGLAFPPLYFYNGGVREFLGTLKQHVFLARSADDANVFILNDLQDPLQRSLSSLELPMAVSVANSPSISSVVHSAPSNEETVERSEDGSSSNSQYHGRSKQKVHDPARDLSIQVLEKFSLVTRFARETTSHLFRDNSDSFSSNGKKSQMQSLLPSDFHETEPRQNDRESVPDEIPVTSDPPEVNL